MSELKTQANEADVTVFLNAIEDAQKRADAFALLELMRTVTGEEPKMWGDAIVGFGKYRYKYASGREGDWMLAAFSPRKTALTVYLMGYFEQRDALLAKLGKHASGKGCVYIKRLKDIDTDALRELIRVSVARARAIGSCESAASG